MYKLQVIRLEYCAGAHTIWKGLSGRNPDVFVREKEDKGPSRLSRKVLVAFMMIQRPLFKSK